MTAPTPGHLERTGYVALQKGGQLAKWTWTEGPLCANEVDIRVTHNGLCHTDVHMVADDWHISSYPFVPGHEVVGIVHAVGSGVHASSCRPGMRVGVGWIANSCRACANCLRGDENLCLEGYTGLIVGTNAKGGFANYLRVAADFVYPIPDGLDSASAAPLLCAGVTVYAPLCRWITRPGQAVAVMGVGGLGHLAVQFASAMGAVVTAIDIDDAKADEAIGLGAARFLPYREFADGTPVQAFDVIINCASADVATPHMVASLNPDGTLVQVGLPAGDVNMAVPLTGLVFGQKRVVGSIVGGRADMRQMLAFAAAKGVRPLVEVMPLAEVNAAFDRIKAGKAHYRIVLLSEEAWAAEKR